MSIECIGHNFKESEAATKTKLIAHAAAACVIPSQCADMTGNQTQEDYCLAKVTFIVGLYGSGKTYLSEKMKKQTGQTYLKTYLRTEQPIHHHSMLERWKGAPCQHCNHPDSANTIV